MITKEDGTRPVLEEPGNAEQEAGKLPLTPNVKRIALTSVFLVILSLCFAKPLYDLAAYALNTTLYSHIILIPFVSGYLIWIMRNQISVGDRNISRRWSPIFAVIGLGTLIGYWAALGSGWEPLLNDYLSVTIFAYVNLAWAGLHYCLGNKAIETIRFPVAFLIFMVPLPEVITLWVELFLQYTSAEAANVLFMISGTPVFRDGLVFQMPGISIEVARECSGIRSSLVLFITSLVAGHMFLRSPWKKWVLAAVIIPIGIARNGLRIFTIAMLCVHINPSMIHSPVHRNGGPPFFVISLIPLLLLLWWFYMREKTARRKSNER